MRRCQKLNTRLRFSCLDFNNFVAVKQILVISFLFSFVMLSLPKDIWHSHTERDHAELSEDSSGDNEEHDCSVCDFDFGLFACSTPSFTISKNILAVQPEKRPLSGVCAAQITSFSRRGPPSA